MCGKSSLATISRIKLLNLLSILIRKLSLFSSIWLESAHAIFEKESVDLKHVM